LVTVAIPCLDEERHIEATLRCVLSQDYAGELEILVADGGSRDRTRAIVGALAADDPRLRLIDNPGRIQARGMNEILRRARGAIIVRLDAHASYAPDYVRRCVEVLAETGADNAGGAQRPLAESPFQRALCAALSSPLGVGGAAYRSPTEEGFVDTVFLGAFRREVFEKVGIYDPGAVTNEDAELNQRILEAGGRIYLSRAIVAHYHPRSSFSALARQYFRYGMGRARTLLKHRRFPTLRPLVPFAGVVGGAALVATSPFQPFTLPLGLAYLGATGIEAKRVAHKS
jgi:glycosyltransferase involved in cell wall biosynthesis